MLFQQMMRFDDDDRSSGLETHSSFNPDYGIAHMNVTANAIRLNNCIKFTDAFQRIIERLTIDINELSFMECEGDIA